MKSKFIQPVKNRISEQQESRIKKDLNTQIDEFFKKGGEIEVLPSSLDNGHKLVAKHDLGITVV